MNNEPVAWIKQNPETLKAELHFDKPAKYWATVVSNPDIPLYTHSVKELTDEDIAKVVHELNQKANTPERWVTAMQIGAETIIQLRDELAILRKASEK